MMIVMNRIFWSGGNICHDHNDYADHHNDDDHHQKYLQVGIYVLQVDEDSLAESLGLQVNPFDLKNLI